MMATKLLKTAMNVWSASDQVGKQKLLRKFLKTQKELTSRNDFVGFLIAEFELEMLREGAESERPGGDV